MVESSLDEITQSFSNILAQLPNLIAQGNLRSIGNFFLNVYKVNKDVALLLLRQLQNEIRKTFGKNINNSSLKDICVFLKCMNSVNPSFLQRIFSSYSDAIMNKLISEFNKLPLNEFSFVLYDLASVNRYFIDEFLEKAFDNLLEYFEKIISSSDLRDIANFIVIISELNTEIASKLLSESTIKIARRISRESLQILKDFLINLSKSKTALDIFLRILSDVLLVRINQAKQRGEQIDEILNILKTIAPELVSKL